MSELKLPELGENIETVAVASVLVAKGDRVRRDQPVIEVETEKASLEVPATEEGVVVELRVAKGDSVKVGEVILVIDSSANAGDAAPAAEGDNGESDAVNVAAKPAAAPAAPAAAATAAEPEADSAAVVAFPEPAPPVERPEPDRVVPASPSTRRLARELGLDVGEVPGSGPGGRISRDDVKAWAKRRLTGAAGAPAAAATAAHELPDFSRFGEVVREPLSSVRKATAGAMATSWATVPHVTQHDTADITQLESMRKRFNRRDEATAKLTMTALVVKTVAGALRRFPTFNASLDLARNEVVLKRYVHVGVAVDTERGLLVPVIRNVDQLGLLEVARALGDLAGRARDKKIKPDELSGASFTVSNLGGLGTTDFSPIVNWPEVAILGVGRAETRAVFEEGAFQPRLVMPLSLSYDHRLVDGADAARFLRWVAEALEQPLLLLVDPTAG